MRAYRSSYMTRRQALNALASLGIGAALAGCQPLASLGGVLDPEGVEEKGAGAIAQATETPLRMATQPASTTAKAGPIATRTLRRRDRAVPSLSAEAAVTAMPSRDALESHYWLERPISPDGMDSIEPFYPYASRGDGTYPIHHGVEFVNPMGTPIRASAPGTIIVAGHDDYQVYGAYADFYGALVIEELNETLNDKPVYVLYGHLSQINVREGQEVDTGELIGLVGMMGIAMGPHLHMEVRYGQNDYGATVNPELWLRPHDGRGTLAGVLLAPDDTPIPEAWIYLIEVGSPDEVVRVLMTYPHSEVNGDPSWHENWCAGDLEAGEYLVEVYYRDENPQTEWAIVEAGGTTWLTIRLSQ
jgi:murein DD-endopeptidase MepM/ murein hydrolase activator NlpD